MILYCIISEVIPELVAKWIAGQAISPSSLCLTKETTDKTEESKDSTESPAKKPELSRSDSKKSDVKKVVSPVMQAVQAVQRRLPHSLDTDVLMANCAWEYGLQWNKDPENMSPLQQSVAYLKCINNVVVQHGVASMLWRTFLVDKLQATCKLMQKVGKAPREYLCRRDVGLTNTALEKFLGLAVELIDTITQVID